MTMRDVLLINPYEQDVEFGYKYWVTRDKRENKVVLATAKGEVLHGYASQIRFLQNSEFDCRKYFDQIWNVKNGITEFWELE